MRVGHRGLGRRDQNEASIVEALRAHGFKVRRIAEKGFADLVAWKSSHGVLLLEVKSSRTAKLTKAQLKHTDDGWPVHLVRSVEDAIKLVQ